MALLSEKPVLLPSKYQDLQVTFDGIQREMLQPMEIFSKGQDGYAIDRVGLADYADDTAAQAGGVPVGGLYRNGSVVMVRVS